MRFFLFSLILFAIFSLLLFWLLTPSVLTAQATFVSPIPEYLMLRKNDQVRLIDLWEPILNQIMGRGNNILAPTAKSALLYDITTEKMLYEKRASLRLPIASLTKIMTAIIAIENKRLDDRYLVTEENLVGENSMGLSPNEVLSLEDLLYGLILPSGNDAAETLASNYPGGREAFIEAMNKKAHALGLKNTHFSNPSGLQGDGQQYSTASDLLVITKYALEIPLFRKVVATYSYTIPETETHKRYYLENETNLLSTYPGVKGVKTGFTPEAGLCLVTYLEYEGHKIIGVILGSENRRGEMKNILDYGLRKLGITPPPFKGNL